MEENKLIKVREDPGKGRCTGAGKNITSNCFESNSIAKENQVSQNRKRKTTETEKERRKQVKYRKTNDNSQSKE